MKNTKVKIFIMGSGREAQEIEKQINEFCTNKYVLGIDNITMGYLVIMVKYVDNIPEDNQVNDLELLLAQMDGSKTLNELRENISRVKAYNKAQEKIKTTRNKRISFHQFMLNNGFTIKDNNWAKNGMFVPNVDLTEFKTICENDDNANIDWKGPGYFKVIYSI